MVPVPRQMRTMVILQCLSRSQRVIQMEGPFQTDVLPFPSENDLDLGEAVPQQETLEELRSESTTSTAPSNSLRDSSSRRWPQCRDKRHGTVWDELT